MNFTKAVEGRKSRKSLDSNKLSTDLKTLVKQSLVKDAVLNETRHILVGKRVRHRFKKQEGGRPIGEWYPGKVISQVQCLSCVVLCPSARSGTNRTVQLQMARGLECLIKKVESLYHLFSKNIGTNQMRSDVA